MSFFRRAATGWAVDRLLRSQGQRRARRGRAYGHGYGRPSGWYAPQRRRRSSRTGFWGPLPYYSRRTRGGSRVTVTGCCLPLALSMAAAGGSLVRVARRR